MSVHVQGTATSPLTQVVEPTSPITGLALVAGTQAIQSVGDYINGSNVPLKIASVSFSNLVNCSVALDPSVVLPLTVIAHAHAQLALDVTATTAGAYSFDVMVTWSL